MPLISIVINADTRPERNTQEGLFAGTVNEDFITDGVFNKIKFFEGFDKEVILFVDKHQEIPAATLEYIHSICDTVVIRRHTHEEKFNDANYVSALSLCRGDIIAHFDQDVSAFTSSPASVQELINLLRQYDYVSYPSNWSPDPVHDPNYDYFWCSTRFFLCKRETLDFTEIKRCLADMDYLYGKYPASVHNPWTEHILGLHAKYNGKKKGVYYPRIEGDKLLIWTWGTYEKWTLRRLNELPYQEIIDFVNSKGGICYPCDVHC